MQAQTRSEGILNLSNYPPLSGVNTPRSGEDSMEHHIELTDNEPNTPNDLPLTGVNTPGSDKGSLELTELMDLVQKLSQRVLDLEKEKAAQAKEVAGLKKKVTKLEQLQRSRILKTHPFKFGSYRRQSLNMENVKDDAETQGRNTKKVNTVSEGINTTSIPETVSTATPRTLPTTTTVFDNEDVTMTMAKTLIKIKEDKAKEKGITFQDVEDSYTPRPVRSITTLQPLPTIDPKDKEKGILQEAEPVKKTKGKDQGDAQIERDAEVALRLQAELNEELMIERERQEEASKVAIAEMFDEVQERMDADFEMAARMTLEEQEKYSIEERARLLAKFFDRRKKQLAAERAEAIRNKPPIKTQLRNLMMTYLKNMGGYTHSQLKGKTFEEIQGLYERQQKRIQYFTPMDSEKEAQKSHKRLKRVAGSYATHKPSKKQKVMNDDSEVNYEPLSKRFPIVNLEYQLLGKIEAKDMDVYKVTRADGSSSYHKDKQAFLRRIDRQDLNDLYKLVQERFQDHPLEGQDLVLWGNLRMIFHSDKKDEVWTNQLEWKLLRWTLHESYGVHSLFIDGTPMEVNMLVEKSRDGGLNLLTLIHS
ncbi:hypothetical protein Tco_1423935 [Tanacetum coccineum]